MRYIIGGAWSVSVVLLLTAGVSSREASDRTGLLGRSNGVEVDAIEVRRQKSSYAAPKADLTYMSLALWFPLPTEVVTSENRYLIWLTELGPVEDDTGKLLLTPERRSAVRALAGEVRTDEVAGRAGGQGPILRLVLNAPARGAAKIRSVKGKAEVYRVKTEGLRFDNLEALVGKPLAHPALKGVSIIPRVEEEKGPLTTFTLQVSPASGRVVNWSVRKGIFGLAVVSEGRASRAKHLELSKTYRGSHAKGASLHLTVAVSVESKAFTFEFSNLELP